MKKELSVGEVAQQLKTPYHRVIRMIKRNELPSARKVGWGWIVLSSDVDQTQKNWLNNIDKITNTKKRVELISDKFEFIPSKPLTRIINK